MSVESHAGQRPERPGVSTRAVLAAAAGALALMFAAVAVFNVIYRETVTDTRLPPPETFPEPRVDTQETALLQRLLAAQRKQLETWRWANDEHTLVQIPIERAMQIVARKGADAYAPLLPPEPALSSPEAGAQRVITPGEASQGSAATHAPPATSGTADKTLHPAVEAPAKDKGP